MLSGMRMTHTQLNESAGRKTSRKYVIINSASTYKTCMPSRIYIIRHKVEKITSISSYIDAPCVYPNRFVLNEKQRERVFPCLRERKGKTESEWDSARCEEEQHAKTWAELNGTHRVCTWFVATHISTRRKGIRFIIIRRMWNGFWWWSCTFSPLFNFQFEIDTFSYAVCNGFIFSALIVYVIWNGTGDILKRTVSFVHCIGIYKAIEPAKQRNGSHEFIFSEKKLPLSLSGVHMHKNTHSPQ